MGGAGGGRCWHVAPRAQPRVSAAPRADAEPAPRCFPAGAVRARGRGGRGTGRTLGSRRCTLVAEEAGSQLRPQMGVVHTAEGVKRAAGGDRAGGAVRGASLLRPPPSQEGRHRRQDRGLPALGRTGAAAHPVRGRRWAVAAPGGASGLLAVTRIPPARAVGGAEPRCLRLCGSARRAVSSLSASGDAPQHRAVGAASASRLTVGAHGRSDGTFRSPSALAGP